MNDQYNPQETIALPVDEFGPAPTAVRLIGKFTHLEQEYFLVETARRQYFSETNPPFVNATVAFRVTGLQAQQLTRAMLEGTAWAVRTLPVRALENEMYLGVEPL